MQNLDKLHLKDKFIHKKSHKNVKKYIFKYGLFCDEIVLLWLILYVNNILNFLNRQTRLELENCFFKFDYCWLVVISYENTIKK